MPRHLASDNYSGAHPEVLEAIARANVGHERPYGNDPLSGRLADLARDTFGPDARILPVTTGTAANVIALSAVMRPVDCVIVGSGAHLHRDECGAPERFIGCKLLLAQTSDGKLSPGSVLPLLADNDVHRPIPRVLSITQCSELGTVYSLDEMRALAAFCRERKLLLHVDGARLANAAAALNCSLRALTTDVGADLLSLGGTKNGLLGAEAVVVLSREAAPTIDFTRKQAMQLMSKMRFVSAQLIAYLEGDLWKRSASHSNAMARRLADGVKTIPGVELAATPQTNAVFARIPPAWVVPLQKVADFYVWNSLDSTVRWMTSFDTTPDDIDSFLAALKALAA